MVLSLCAFWGDFLQFIAIYDKFRKNSSISVNSFIRAQPVFMRQTRQLHTDKNLLQIIPHKVSHDLVICTFSLTKPFSFSPRLFANIFL
jgi:hypothetical protein